MAKIGTRLKATSSMDRLLLAPLLPSLYSPLYARWATEPGRFTIVWPVWWSISDSSSRRTAKHRTPNFGMSAATPKSTKPIVERRTATRRTKPRNHPRRNDTEKHLHASNRMLRNYPAMRNQPACHPWMPPSVTVALEGAERPT